jgi:hypothetical protein
LVIVTRLFLLYRYPYWSMESIRGTLAGRKTWDSSCHVIILEKIVRSNLPFQEKKDEYKKISPQYFVNDTRW